jgi:hypothetical protein
MAGAKAPAFFVRRLEYECIEGSPFRAIDFAGKLWLGAYSNCMII